MTLTLTKKEIKQISSELVARCVSMAKSMHEEYGEIQTEIIDERDISDVDKLIEDLVDDFLISDTGSGSPMGGVVDDYGMTMSDVDEVYDHAIAAVKKAVGKYIRSIAGELNFAGGGWSSHTSPEPPRPKSWVPSFWNGRIPVNTVSDIKRLGRQVWQVDDGDCTVEREAEGEYFELSLSDWMKRVHASGEIDDDTWNEIIDVVDSSLRDNLNKLIGDFKELTERAYPGEDLCASFIIDVASTDIRADWEIEYH